MWRLELLYAAVLFDEKVYGVTVDFLWSMTCAVKISMGDTAEP